LNGFPKRSTTTFSDSPDCQTGQSRDGRGTVPKPVEPVLGLVEPVSNAEKQVLNFLSEQSGTYVGSEKWFFLRHS
jgi:hypothetical protein